MKLNSGVLGAMLVILACVSAGSAQASNVRIKAPDPGCESIGTIFVPVVTVGGAPGDCTDFTWGPAAPTDFLGVVVTDVQPPLTCEIVGEEGESFNTCKVIFGDITATPNSLGLAILEAAIGLIPGLTAPQVAALDAALSDLPPDDGGLGFLLASCNPKLSSCTDLVQGEMGGVSTPEPPGLLLLGVGISLLGIGGWKNRKLTAYRRWVS
jgi:hypothetical protein